MFESIVLNRPVVRGRLDLGLIAETMLFYDNVHLLLNRGVLEKFAKEYSLDGLINLHEEFGLKISYHREMAATITNNQGLFQSNAFSMVSFGGKSGERQIKTASQEIDHILCRLIGDGRRAQKTIRRLKKAVSPSLIDETEQVALADAAQREATDITLMDWCFRQHVGATCPDAHIDPAWFFRVMPMGKEFFIETNADFQYLDRVYRTVPGQADGSISGASVANALFQAMVDGHYAGKYMSSFVTDPSHSAIFRRIFTNMIRRREQDVNEMDIFNDQHLREVGTIKEVINSGERSMTDFLQVLRRAKRFKAWLKGVNPDESLAGEYYRAATAETWVDRLPTKGVRWVVAGALGSVFGDPLTSTVASVGMSAMDELIAYALKGWRPSHFVEGSLTRFLD